MGDIEPWILESCRASEMKHVDLRYEPTYIGRMLGLWVRVWPSEDLTGEVFAVSGEFLVCRARSGASFLVAMEDVRNGKCRTYGTYALARADLGRERSTATVARRRPRLQLVR